MPQARSGGSRGSRSSASSRSRSSGSSRSTSSRAKSTGGSRAKSSRAASSRSTRAGSTKARSTARKRTAKKASPAEARLEAAAQRLRKLNERIIDASRDAGETTLTSYERALKAIATSIEKGPGSSDVEWVSNLATAQAKFIRDLTNSWTKRARKALK